MLRGKSTWNVPLTPEFTTVCWPRTSRGARSLRLCDCALTPREGAGAASPTPAPSTWGAVVGPGAAFAVGASTGRATLEQTCRWDVKGTPSESLDGRTGHREAVPAGLTLWTRDLHPVDPESVAHCPQRPFPHRKQRLREPLAGEWRLLGNELRSWWAWTKQDSQLPPPTRSPFSSCSDLKPSP